MLNALHAKVVPDVGGATRFLDSTGETRARGPHLGSFSEPSPDPSPECGTHAGALRAGAAPAGVFSLDELAALAHSTLTVSADCTSDFAGAPDADVTPLGMPHVHPALQRPTL